MQGLTGIPRIGRVDVQLRTCRSRRWYGPWRCAWRAGRVRAGGTTSQALGRSASICGRLIVSCRSSRLRLLRRRARHEALLSLCVAAPACAAAASASTAFGFGAAGPAPAPRSPSHPARCARLKYGHPSSAQSASHADGSPDGSRQTRKRPAKTSPRSDSRPCTAPARTAAIACRQPQDSSISARVVGMSTHRAWRLRLA